MDDEKVSEAIAKFRALKQKVQAGHSECLNDLLAFSSSEESLPLKTISEKTWHVPLLKIVGLGEDMTDWISAGALPLKSPLGCAGLGLRFEVGLMYYIEQSGATDVSPMLKKHDAQMDYKIHPIFSLALASAMLKGDTKHYFANVKAMLVFGGWKIATNYLLQGSSNKSSQTVLPYLAQNPCETSHMLCDLMPDELFGEARKKTELRGEMMRRYNALQIAAAHLNLPFIKRASKHVNLKKSFLISISVMAIRQARNPDMEVDMTKKAMEIIKFLLSKGVDPNEDAMVYGKLPSDSLKPECAAVVDATLLNLPELVKLLIDHGAKVSSKALSILVKKAFMDPEMKAILDECLDSNRVSISEIFTVPGEATYVKTPSYYGPDIINLYNRNRLSRCTSAFVEAVNNNQLDLVKRFLDMRSKYIEKGPIDHVDLDLPQDIHRNTAIFYAKSKEAIALLVKAGADLSYLNYNRDTVLMDTLRRKGDNFNRVKITEYLLALGAKPRNLDYSCDRDGEKLSLLVINGLNGGVEPEKGSTEERCLMDATEHTAILLLLNGAGNPPADEKLFNYSDDWGLTATTSFFERYFKWLKRISPGPFWDEETGLFNEVPNQSPFELYEELLARLVNYAYFPCNYANVLIDAIKCGNVNPDEWGSTIGALKTKFCKDLVGKGWSPVNHALCSRDTKELVKTVKMIENHLKRENTPSALPYLPTELWHHILSQQIAPFTSFK